MAPDWAFGRIELTKSAPVTSEAESAATARITVTPKKVSGFLVFRKLSLGEAEGMKGWRIARAMFMPAANESEASTSEKSASPPLPRRQRGGKKVAEAAEEE